MLRELIRLAQIVLLIFGCVFSMSENAMAQTGASGVTLSVTLTCTRAEPTAPMTCVATTLDPPARPEFLKVTLVREGSLDSGAGTIVVRVSGEGLAVPPTELSYSCVANGACTISSASPISLRSARSVTFTATPTGAPVPSAPAWTASSTLSIVQGALLSLRCTGTAPPTLPTTPLECAIRQIGDTPFYTQLPADVEVCLPATTAWDSYVPRTLRIDSATGAIADRISPEPRGEIAARLIRGTETCWTYPASALARTLSAASDLTFNLTISKNDNVDSRSFTNTPSFPVGRRLRCGAGNEFPQETELDRLTGQHLELCREMHHPCEASDGPSLPERTGLYGGSATHFDRLVLVFGPDGTLRGSMPPSIPEHVAVFALVYHRQTGNYRIRVEGCAEPPVRIEPGSVAGPTRRPQDPTEPLPATDPPTSDTPWTVSYQRINRCSADTRVTVQVVVPEQGTYCDGVVGAARFQTEAISYIGVSVAGVFNFGDYNTVGLEPIPGTDTRRIYQRNALVEFRPAAGVFVYPAGIPSTTGTPFLQRFGFGTVVALDRPFTDLNVLVALSILPGLSVLAGGRFARLNPHLAAGYSSGEVYRSGADLPRDDRWELTPALSLGLTIDQQIFNLLTGRK